MYYVYVLQSRKDGNIYIGSTSNLKKRFEVHNAGGVESTKLRRPLVLIFYEAFRSKTDALVDEKFFKSGYGREVLRGKIKNSL